MSALAASIVHEHDMPREGKEAALRWLTAFHALGEANRLEDGKDWAPELAQPLVDELRNRPDVAVTGLVVLLRGCSVLVAPDLFVACLRSTFGTPQRGRVLGLEVGRTHRLGWAAVQSAWPMLHERRRDTILEKVGARVQALPGQGRDFAAAPQLVAELTSDLPFAVRPTPPVDPPAGPRGRRRL